MILIIIKINYDQEFAFFESKIFQKDRGFITGKQYAFYWINNDQ